MTKLEKFTTKRNERYISLDGGKAFILKAGCQVFKMGGESNIPSELVHLRKKSVGADGKTTKDLSFKSLSAMAKFIAGYSVSGNAYFKGAVKDGAEEESAATATSATTTKEAKASPKSASKKAPKTASSVTEVTATPTKNAKSDSSPMKAVEKPTEEAKAVASKKQEAKAEADGKPSSSMKNEYPKLTKAQMDANNALAKEIKDFLAEFYTIDPRSINTMKYAKDPNEFILNSMELIGVDERLIQDAKSKFKSEEWKLLMKRLKDAPTSHGRINQRLEIFYGPAGTGKTTQAIAENPTATIVAASAGADPDDLFTFIDPNSKSWVKTALAEAMENGKAIVIDEINLFNEVVLARLQAVTDNKSVIQDRGVDIRIRDGFKVIGTMNLETNIGGKKPLPDPLVSRCQRIEKMDKPYLGWVF